LIFDGAEMRIWLSIALLCLACVSAWADPYGDTLNRYGKPDRFSSTEKDKPRPPIPTRFLEYKTEGVRFVFVPDAPVSSPPPYKMWILVGAQDIRNGVNGGKLTTAQIEERMAKRKK
jgi:hypothetical protein